MNPRAFAAVWLSAVLASATAQTSSYRFYDPSIPYGSEAMFSPLSLFVNGSYDILRNGAHSKDIGKIEYRDGWLNIRDNITHPIREVRAYGVGRFFRREFFNLKFNIHETQFAPNVLNHTIGNGMQYVKLAEWYDHHRFPLPYVWSALTTTSYQVMNEINENSGFRGTNVDPISDLLIFNPLGFIVWSFDGTRRFFSETLPLYDWSLMPVFRPSSYNLESAGQSWVIKKPVSADGRYSAVFYWGIHGMAGVSVTPDYEHYVSVTGGIVVNKLQVRNTEQARYLTPNLDGSLGLFYDRKHSLLTSLLVEGPKFYALQLTLYPAFNGSPWTPGAYVSWNERKQFVIGLSWTYLPAGLGGGN